MKSNLYESVLNDLKNKIENGVYRQNEKLPSEDELCSVYSVSKVTLRKALSLLIDQGYLQVLSRVGYFVKPPDNTRYIIQFDTECASTEPIDRKEVVRVLCVRQTTPDQRAFLRIESVNRFYSNNLVSAVEVASIWVHHSIPANATQETLMHYQKQVFTNIHHYTERKEMKILATNGSEELCNWLDCVGEDPILGIEVRYYDQYNILFAKIETFYVGECGLLHGTLER